jgi:hypothetical protein
MEFGVFLDGQFVAAHALRLPLQDVLEQSQLLRSCMARGPRGKWRLQHLPYIQ